MCGSLCGFSHTRGAVGRKRRRARLSAHPATRQRSLSRAPRSAAPRARSVDTINAVTSTAGNWRSTKGGGGRLLATTSRPPSFERQRRRQGAGARARARARAAAAAWPRPSPYRRVGAEADDGDGLGARTIMAAAEGSRPHQVMSRSPRPRRARACVFSVLRAASVRRVRCGVFVDRRGAGRRLPKSPVLSRAHAQVSTAFRAAPPSP